MESASDESNYGVEEGAGVTEWLADAKTIPELSEHDHDHPHDLSGIEMSRTTFLKSQIDRMEADALLMNATSGVSEEVILDDIALKTDAAVKDMNIRKRS